MPIRGDRRHCGGGMALIGQATRSTRPRSPLRQAKSQRPSHPRNWPGCWQALTG